jgi:predicted nucleic acid-binding protein
MKPIVLDASAAVALVREEAAKPEIQRILDQHDGKLLVPAFFWLEVINSLMRRHGLPASAVLEAIRELEELGITATGTDGPARLMIIDVAERQRLTAYDATYVVLAEMADGKLLTTDRDQARAAGRRAILVDAAGRISEPPPRYEIEPTWPSWRGAAAYLGELRRRAAEESAAWAAAATDPEFGA